MTLENLPGLPNGAERESHILPRCTGMEGDLQVTVLEIADPFISKFDTRFAKVKLPPSLCVVVFQCQ